MSEDKSKLQLIGEISQANNKNLELIEDLNKKEDEIERLNNIINELENELYKFYAYEGYNDEQIKDKIKELKGDGSND